MSDYLVEKVEDPNLIRWFNILTIGGQAILAGGVFKHILHIERDGKIFASEIENFSYNQPKDIDLYFSSKKEYDGLNNNLSNWSGFDKRIESEHSTMFVSRIPKLRASSVCFDLVKKVFGTPAEILDSFDFTITQCAMYRENGEVYLMYHKDFKDHLENKILEYGSTPEKSGNIIERMMRYITYGYKPNNETAQKCLQAFCESFDELKNVNTEQLLSYKEFRKYCQMQETELENINKRKANGTRSRWDYMDKDIEHKFKHKTFLFICFLRSYWESIVEVDNFSIASFSNKYAASFNLSKLIQQMSENYSMKEIDYLCSNLAREFDLRLEPENPEAVERLQTVQPSFTLMKLLEFFKEQQEKIGTENIHHFLKDLFSYRFVPQSGQHHIQCMDCGKMINQKECECDEVSYLLELEADVILKTLLQKYDEQWWKDCLSFFSQIHDSKLDQVLTLEEWHQSLDNNLFDPDLPPSLLFPLMMNS